MNLDVIQSFRWQISHHKVLAAGILGISASTGIWAAASLPGRTATEAAQPASYSPLNTERDSQSAGTHASLDEALKLGRTSRKALESVADYTAVFTKTELLDGRLVTQTMDFKCRQQPFSVYLRNHRRRGGGREVIYVAGANDGDLLVHEAGLKSLIGTLKLKPDSPKVLETNRHPLTDVGLVRLIEAAMDYWKTDKREARRGQVDVRILHDVKVGTAVCDEVQVTHREKNPRISYQIGHVYFDTNTRFPVQAELYGWPKNPGEESPLLERYTYTHIKTNVGLTNRDFDPRNSDYEFVSRE